MSLSPARRKKEATRYGPIKSGEVSFSQEERFAWQKAQFSSDCVYDIPELRSSKSAVFGTAVQRADGDDTADAKKRSNGPGSYDPARSYNFNSEYITKTQPRFASAPRESMAMKTPSPGPVYNIENCFYLGPEKRLGIGFGNAQRKPLYEGCGADADLYIPKPDYGHAVSIGRRIKHKLPGADGPGPIYEVHKKINFQTGPAYTFGRGRGSRFKEISFLPELD